MSSSVSHSKKEEKTIVIISVILGLIALALLYVGSRYTIKGIEGERAGEPPALTEYFYSLAFRYHWSGVCFLGAAAVMLMET